MDTQEENLKQEFLKVAKVYFDFIGSKMKNKYEEKLRKADKFYNITKLYEYDSSELPVITEKKKKLVDELYRKISLKYHPDRNSDGAEIFKKAQDLREKGDIKGLKEILEGSDGDDSNHDEENFIDLGQGEKIPLNIDNICHILSSPIYQTYIRNELYDFCSNYVTKEELILEIRKRIELLKFDIRYYKSSKTISEEKKEQNLREIQEKIELLELYLNTPRLLRQIY